MLDRFKYQVGRFSVIFVVAVLMKKKKKALSTFTLVYSETSFSRNVGHIQRGIILERERSTHLPMHTKENY